MRRLGKIVQSLPPGAAWFFAAAMLFLLGAANAGLHGLHRFAQVGIVGALCAIAIAFFFCAWWRPPGLGRR